MTWFGAVILTISCFSEHMPATFEYFGLNFSAISYIFGSTPGFPAICWHGFDIC